MKKSRGKIATCFCRLYCVHSKNTFVLKIDFLIRFSSYLDNIEITGFFFIPVNPRQPSNDKAFGVFKYEENHSQSDVFYVFFRCLKMFFYIMVKNKKLPKKWKPLALVNKKNKKLPKKWKPLALVRFIQF